MLVGVRALTHQVYGLLLANVRAAGGCDLDVVLCSAPLGLVGGFLAE